ncbi:MAG: hypothetical protein WCN98_09940 [Verrucomicrobiaceae bacterium]
MQATLEIDDDVLETVTKLAEQDHVSTGRKLSELARNGLRTGKRPLSDFGPGEVRNGVPVFPSRGEVITLEHVQRLIESEGV